MELANKDKNTIVIGFVEEIEPYYKRATVFVAPPLTGGGIIIKTLDVMASSTPVVTTSKGCEGIDVVHGEHLMIANTVEAFAVAVERLLSDAAFKASIAKNARSLVKQRYSWESLIKDMDAYYKIVLQAPKR